MKKRTVPITALFFIGVFALSEFVVNFLRTVVIARMFGANYTTDAYFLAYGFYITFLLLFTNIIMVCFLPVLSNVHAEQGEQKGMLFARSFFTAISIIAVILIALGLGCGNFLIRYFFRGYPHEIRQCIRELLTMMSPAFFLLATSSVLTSILYHYRYRVVPSLCAFLNGSCILVCLIFWGERYGMKSVIWGIWVGAGVYFVFEYVWMAWRKRFVPCLDFASLRAHSGQVAHMAWPLVVSIVFLHAYQWVEYYLASFMRSGSLSSLQYARGISEIPVRLFAILIGAFVFPRIADHVSKRDRGALYADFVRFSRLVMVCLVPLSVFLALFSEPVAELLLKRGKFSLENVHMVSRVLPWYSLALIGSGLGFLLNYTYAALKDTVTLLKVNVITVIAVIVFDSWIVRFLSYEGLAIGYSVFIFLQYALITLHLYGKVFGKTARPSLIFMMKIAAAVSIAAGIVHSVYLMAYPLASGGTGLAWNMRMAALLTAVMVLGAVIYAMFLRLMRLEEAVVLFNRFSQSAGKQAGVL